MANPRTSSDLWDASGEEDFRPYPNATPRRVALAHALGVVGVLGTLGLAIAAFVPRMPSVMDKVHTVFGRSETEAQSQSLTTPLGPARDGTTPKLEVVPQITATSPAEPPAATAAPPVAATEPTSAAVAVPPAVVTTVPSPATAPSTSPPAADTAAATGRALANGAPSVPEVPPAPAATPATESVAPQAATASVSTAKPATPAHSPAAAKKTARSEPPLTPREIERRQQRYELWLKQQGLERVH